MVQDQLVDYINAQMKLGVSRDAIKGTLVGAGWAAADVEDTLKKLDAAGTAAPATMAGAAAVAVAKPAAGPMPLTSQTIKVSDLVSAAPSLSPSSASSPSFFGASPAAKSMAAASVSTAKSPLTGPAAKPATILPGVKTEDTFQAASYSGMKPHASHGALITEVVLGVLVVAFGALAGFLYMQNSGLSSQLAGLNGRSAGVSTQLSDLQAQVAASTTALAAQVSALTGQSDELKAELSLLAAPSGTAPGATSTATINGMVSATKTGYMITAEYGAKVYVTNAKAAAVVAALAPLLPGAQAVATSTVSGAVASSTAQFTGFYVPGSDSMTLTAVNGAAMQ